MHKIGKGEIGRKLEKWTKIKSYPHLWHGKKREK